MAFSTDLLWKPQKKAKDAPTTDPTATWPTSWYRRTTREAHTAIANKIRATDIKAREVDEENEEKSNLDVELGRLDEFV